MDRRLRFSAAEQKVASANMKHTVDWFVSVQLLGGVFSSSRDSLVFLPHVQKKRGLVCYK